jgi:hypothetical protein
MRRFVRAGDLRSWPLAPCALAIQWCLAPLPSAACCLLLAACCSLSPSPSPPQLQRGQAPLRLYALGALRPCGWLPAAGCLLPAIFLPYLPRRSFPMSGTKAGAPCSMLLASQSDLRPKPPDNSLAKSFAGGVDFVEVKKPGGFHIRAVRRSLV